MDHGTTMRRAYDLLNGGDVDGFGELLAEDFVEHEETPGLAPTRDGVVDTSSRCTGVPFRICGWTPRTF